MDHHEIKTLYAIACEPNRLYPIRSEKNYGFYAGRLSGGGQALVTCGYSKEVCVFKFSAAGDYLGFQRRTPTLTADLDTDIDAHVRQLHNYLAAEFGFVPDLIRIKRFHEAVESVSISPLPHSLRELAEHPAKVEADDYPRKLDELRRWVEEEAFVLNTWNDYWLDANGKVTDS